MAKALRVFIVLLLLLSIAALVLGSMLFSKRNIIKDRTLKLEASTVQFAQNLRMENAPTQEQLKDVMSMDGVLARVAITAANRIQELDDTKQDLANTKQDLENTRLELANTKNELEQTKTRVAELTDQLARKEQELAAANTRVIELEQDVSSKQIQIDDLTTQMAEKEDEVNNLNDKIAMLEKTLDKYEQQSGSVDMPLGLGGTILLVNPDWNFVVIDIGSEKGVKVTAEMLVHRADALVGKVKISAVKDSVAVAEILPEWEKAPLQEGDHVFF